MENKTQRTRRFHKVHKDSQCSLCFICELCVKIVKSHLADPVPLGDNEAKELLTALIDSGSDGTLIPLDILEEVGARHVGEARLRGILGNRRSVVDVYLVSLRIGPNTVHAARAVAVPEGDEIILGRNVLNHLVITLNGPASVIEIPA